MNNLIIDEKRGIVHFWQNHTYHGTEINETYKYFEPVKSIGHPIERYALKCLDKTTNTKVYIETPINDTVLIIKGYEE